MTARRDDRSTRLDWSLMTPCLVLGTAWALLTDADPVRWFFISVIVGSVLTLILWLCVEDWSRPYGIAIASTIGPASWFGYAVVGGWYGLGLGFFTGTAAFCGWLAYRVIHAYHLAPRESEDAESEA